jgi:hypothetical protein
MKWVRLPTLVSQTSKSQELVNFGKKNCDNLDILRFFLINESAVTLVRTDTSAK